MMPTLTCAWAPAAKSSAKAAPKRTFMTSLLVVGLRRVAYRGKPPKTTLAGRQARRRAKPAVGGAAPALIGHDRRGMAALRDVAAPLRAQGSRSRRPGEEQPAEIRRRERARAVQPDVVAAERCPAERKDRERAVDDRHRAGVGHRSRHPGPRRESPEPGREVNERERRARAEDAEEKAVGRRLGKEAQDAEPAVDDAGDQAERAGRHDAFAAMESLFWTHATPATDCAVCCARCLVSSESTWPCSVTTPALLCTSMFSVFSPTSFASAARTLAVIAASAPASFASAMPASSLCPGVCAEDCDAPALARDSVFGLGWQPAARAAKRARSRNLMSVLQRELGRAPRQASRRAGGGSPARGSGARGARRAAARPGRRAARTRRARGSRARRRGLPRRRVPGRGRAARSRRSRAARARTGRALRSAARAARRRASGGA